MTAVYSTQRQRVVITGLGIASALGCDVDAFWQALRDGRSGVVAVDDLELYNCRTRIGARVTGYTPSDHFSPRDLRRLSLTSQFALIAASQALEQAKLDDDAADRSRAGVILGSCGGAYVAFESIVTRFFSEHTISDPLSVPVAMSNAPASNISIRFGCRGPVMTIDAACASSAHAIGYAFNMIRYGMSSLVITGGADTIFSPGLLHAWSSLRSLSERNDVPAEACRPFSLDRDGLVLGEGAGMLVLESEQSARARGAPILAELTGYGANGDGHHLTQPSPDGISESMRMALADAGLRSEDIDYINAHGTATPLNDKVETAAIKQVFGDRSKHIPVVGIKGALGHSMGASGAIELISCVLSIRDSVVPPTINLMRPDPECDLDYVPEGSRPWNVRHAMSNSFGFGGSNGVLAVSRYQP
jgi:beta-ketoacyl-acyl-carrier-protein synthase II